MLGLNPGYLSESGAHFCNGNCMENELAHIGDTNCPGSNVVKPLQDPLQDPSSSVNQFFSSFFHLALQRAGRTFQGAARGRCAVLEPLFPFVYGVIIGFPLTLLHIPLGETILQAASIWILLGQVNLYRRVNELCDEAKDVMALPDGRVLWEWWALLPPPLDVVVGLRQVHFLSEYWRIRRGESYQKDVVAEDLFPFISAKQRFTLKEFFRTPSMWFWFTKDWQDFEFEFLQEDGKNN